MISLIGCLIEEANCLTSCELILSGPALFLGFIL